MPTRTRALGGLTAALLAVLAVLVLNAAPSSAATPYCRIDGDPELPSSCPVRRPTPPPPTMMTPTTDPTPTPQPTMVPTSNPNVECWLEDFETDNIFATDTQREAYQFTVAVTFCVDKATRLIVSYTPFAEDPIVSDQRVAIIYGPVEQPGSTVVPAGGTFDVSFKFRLIVLFRPGAPGTAEQEYTHDLGIHIKSNSPAVIEPIGSFARTA